MFLNKFGIFQIKVVNLQSKRKQKRMKKIILLTFTALMMVGCSTDNTSVKNTAFYDTKIIEIDSYEYIISHVYLGNVIIHKENCRFCKERRQKELEELVNKLKEK